MGITDIINSMKKMLLPVVLLALFFCGTDKSRETRKFRDSIIDAAKIGSFQKLTDDGRSVYPIFDPGDTIVYYQRLLLTDLADTFAYFPEQIIKPYGVNIKNNDLYTLQGKLGYPSAEELDTTDYPLRKGEETVWAILSPNRSTVAFETIKNGDKDETHIIYLEKGDSTRRLSYGDTSCFLERFSNTGRYLTAIYSTSPTWIMIFDLQEDRLYRINRPDSMVESIDYLTSFSSDDRLMLFIRSAKVYQWGDDYFGDVWMLKFNSGL
jgi:hypothetical protein